MSTVENSASALISVLDKGYVRLDGALADDLSVVNSARVSFNRQATEMGPPERGLINFLMSKRHGTPFEHNLFRFEIKAPIFIAREWMRHRWGSFNEWSGRYSELENDFYIPAAHNVRQQIGKPGAYHFQPVNDDTAAGYRYILDDFCGSAFELYKLFLEAVPDQNVDPVAKELARLVLPVNIYTKFFWSVNARSLMNFISLRNAQDAMWEIKCYAEVIEKLFESQMPHTYHCFVERGRIAP